MLRVTKKLISSQRRGGGCHESELHKAAEEEKPGNAAAANATNPDREEKGGPIDGEGTEDFDNQRGID